MKIDSEQDMLAFAKKLGSSWNAAFRDILRPTGSNLARSPVTTGATKRVEKSTFQLPQVIELIGDVGAGKTTFVRGLAEGLGIKEPVTSPSFTISKSYTLKNGGHLVHYDFYRLQDPGLMVEDLKENLTKNNIVVIEWGESIANLLPKNRLTIKIKYTDSGREIEL